MWSVAPMGANGDLKMANRKLTHHLEQEAAVQRAADTASQISQDFANYENIAFMVAREDRFKTLDQILDQESRLDWSFLQRRLQRFIQAQEKRRDGQK